MKYIVGTWFAVIFALSGCSFDVTEIQAIDIETYSDTSKNVKLAEDLVYYDPRYIAHKVPSFNEATSQGIKLGYFVRSSDGKPSYRVTYSMKVSAVESNIDSLKSDFETFIPKLADFHASKEELFTNLSPKGQAWASSLFGGSAEDILSTGANLLRETVTAEQLTAVIKGLSSDYGSPISTDFVRAQYYEEFDDFPESVSLYYVQAYKNNRKALVRVSFTQENGNWAVMGFRVEPYI
ncbi:DUF4019 domain-containing protein [Shewanella submarina]|uniref:DUF4019 domain-containing protein n=1 Tax=Shewanella submarina TaxID=2016376 RepID=A0ABV7G8W1_9GAMM|nr:DUF4019 domain-containing protein [Shewanella submarina]MCL1038496.1 DUF4019 domain-containing protein [Shewanella submarina]